MPTQRSEAVTVSLDSDDLMNVVCTTIEAVAEAKGTDPLEMEAQLYDAVDPEALARTVGSIDGYVAFELADCEVVIHGDGRVVAGPLSDEGIEAPARSRTEAEPTRRDGRSNR